MHDHVEVVEQNPVTLAFTLGPSGAYALLAEAALFPGAASGAKAASAGSASPASNQAQPSK